MTEAKTDGSLRSEGTLTIKANAVMAKKLGVKQGDVVAMISFSNKDGVTVAARDGDGIQTSNYAVDEIYQAKGHEDKGVQVDVYAANGDKAFHLWLVGSHDGHKSMSDRGEHSHPLEVGIISERSNGEEYAIQWLNTAEPKQIQEDNGRSLVVKNRPLSLSTEVLNEAELKSRMEASGQKAELKGVKPTENAAGTDVQLTALAREMAAKSDGRG